MIAELQAKIRTGSKTLLYSTIVLLSCLATQSMAASKLPPYSLSYSPTRDPFADGRDALMLAHQTKRRVLIELGGSWCGWCMALEQTIASDQQVSEQLHRYFVVLKVNISEENENADFLTGLPPNRGYPHIYVAGVDGQIIHSQDTGKFLTDGRYDARRILAFIERWRQPTIEKRHE